MAQFFSIHASHPQPRLVRQAAEIIRQGGLIAYPTDSCYALGCHIGDANALERIRQVRGIDEKHHLTLMCRDLSEIAIYAIVDNTQFRLLKSLTPGSFTFILRATREVPKRLMHPKRRSIGVRITSHRVAQALLIELAEPMLSATVLLPGEKEPPSDPIVIRKQLEHCVDLVVDGGFCGTTPTTILDLTEKFPRLVRAGAGAVDAIRDLRTDEDD